jgi:hypothetical protein
MTVEKQLESLATMPFGGPVVVKHAAFEVSPASFDEVTRLLRAREYHHVFDASNGAIYMDNIALTRAPQPPAPEFCTAWVLENGQEGEAHRYMALDRGGVPRPTRKLDDTVIRFSRQIDAVSFATLLSLFSAVCSPTMWVSVPHIWR